MGETRQVFLRPRHSRASVWFSSMLSICFLHLSVRRILSSSLLGPYSVVRLKSNRNSFRCFVVMEESQFSHAMAFVKFVIGRGCHRQVRGTSSTALG